MSNHEQSITRTAINQLKNQGVTVEEVRSSDGVNGTVIVQQYDVRSNTHIQKQFDTIIEDLDTGESE